VPNGTILPGVGPGNPGEFQLFIPHFPCMKRGGAITSICFFPYPAGFDVLTVVLVQVRIRYCYEMFSEGDVHYSEKMALSLQIYPGKGCPGFGASITGRIIGGGGET